MSQNSVIVRRERVDIKGTIQLARTLFVHHRLVGWSFSLDANWNRFGACYYDTKTITLSRPITLLSTKPEVRDTILHEIAHALVGAEHGHDEVWQAMALKIGARPEATGHLNQIAARYLQQHRPQ